MNKIKNELIIINEAWIIPSLENEIIKTDPAIIKIKLNKNEFIFILYIDWKFDTIWIIDPLIRNKRDLYNAWIIKWNIVIIIEELNNPINIYDNWLIVEKAIIVFISDTDAALKQAQINVIKTIIIQIKYPIQFTLKIA